MLWNPIRDTLDASATIDSPERILVDTADETVLAVSGGGSGVKAFSLDLSTEKYSYTTPNGFGLAFVGTGDYVGPNGRKNISDGSVVWDYASGANTAEYPVYDPDGGRILAIDGADNTKVTAYDPATGSELTWGTTTSDGATLFGPAALSSDTLFLRSTTGIHAFALSNGSEQGSFTETGLQSQLYTTGSHLFVLETDNGDLLKLDSTATQVNSVQLQSSINATSPALAGDRDAGVVFGAVRDNFDDTVYIRSYNTADLSENWSNSFTAFGPNAANTNTSGEVAFAATVPGDTNTTAIVFLSQSSGAVSTSLEIDATGGQAVVVQTGETVYGTNGFDDKIVGKSRGVRDSQIYSTSTSRPLTEFDVSVRT